MAFKLLNRFLDYLLNEKETPKPVDEYELISLWNLESEATLVPFETIPRITIVSDTIPPILKEKINTIINENSAFQNATVNITKYLCTNVGGCSPLEYGTEYEKNLALKETEFKINKLKTSPLLFLNWWNDSEHNSF